MNSVFFLRYEQKTVCKAMQKLTLINCLFLSPFHLLIIFFSYWKIIISTEIKRDDGGKKKQPLNTSGFCWE